MGSIYQLLDTIRNRFHYGTSSQPKRQVGPLVIPRKMGAVQNLTSKSLLLLLLPLSLCPLAGFALLGFLVLAREEGGRCSLPEQRGECGNPIVGFERVV